MTYGIPIPGGRLAAYDQGAGPTVVLVHGGTSTAAVDWASVLPYLVPWFRVVSFDQRGHGRSRGFDEGIGTDRFGLDLLQALRYLGIPSAAFVGFSVGANTLLRLVPRHPSIARALVLIGAAAKGRPERVEKITSGPWLDALVDLEHDDADGPDHWKRIRNALATDWADRHDVRPEHGARITCPTLVLHGAQDRIEPVAEAERVAERIPRSELQLVEGAGHMAQVDRPEVVGRAIRDFLGRELDVPVRDLLGASA